VRPDALQVDRGGDNFNVVQGELGALGDDLAVEGDERAAVVVESVAIAALLVGVEVETAGLRVITRSERYCEEEAVVRTLSVASLIKSMRVRSLRSSWCEPDELVKISTPSRAMSMWGLQEQGYQSDVMKDKKRETKATLPE